MGRAVLDGRTFFFKELLEKPLAAILPKTDNVDNPEQRKETDTSRSGKTMYLAGTPSIVHVVLIIDDKESVIV